MNGREYLDLAELTVPKQHGQRLVAPTFAQLVDSLRKSPSRRDEAFEGLDIGGIPLSTLRRQARQSAIKLAVKHTSQYRNVLLPKIGADGQLVQQEWAVRDWDYEQLAKLPIVMGGHQPDLFHCGVWFKNFLLAKLAGATGALAIHFLVDNDLCRATSIAIPVHSPPKSTEVSAEIEALNRDGLSQVSAEAAAVNSPDKDWQWKAVHYDLPRSPLPWENCFLQDVRCWRSFPGRVQKLLPKLNGLPMLDHLWHLVDGDVVQGDSLGCLLSRARHKMEAEFGLQTLEVPLSVLSGTQEFARFSLHLLGHLPELQEIYNQELVNYRKAHRIRNHAQPLPGLARQGDWYEAPWWFYLQGDQERHPLWVSISGDRLTLSNHKGWTATLSGPLNGEVGVEQWMELSERGVCLRPRALLTTMYARLILSDLFIHGMGGARYDQLTDRIIERFFGLQPPLLGLATATLHLPIQDVDDQLLQPLDETIVGLQQKLRTAQSNPEAILRADERVDTSSPSSLEFVRLLEDKRRLLAAIPPKGEKWQWHQQMKQIQERLAELALPSVEKVQSKVNRLQSLQLQQAVVHSREVSFCLFPRETVVECLGNW